jgi:hypothetical protein
MQVLAQNLPFWQVLKFAKTSDPPNFCDLRTANLASIKRIWQIWRG